MSLYKPQSRGPIGTHPTPCEFTMDPQIGTPHSLHSWVPSQTHTFTHSHTAQYFHSAPWTWDRFHPKRQLLGCLIGSWSDTPSVSWGRPELELRFLPVWQAALPLLLPVPHWILLCIQGPHPDLPGGQALQIKLSIVTWQDHFSQQQGRRKAPSPQSQQRAPKNVMGNSRHETLDNILLCQHRLMSKSWALRTNRSHLINPCKQVTEENNNKV
jgi:hypothetical protein